MLVRIVSISVNLIPFIIAIAILIFGIYKHKKGKYGNYTWAFSSSAIVMVLLMPTMFCYKNVFGTVVNSVLPLLIYFVGYLIIDLALFIVVQPTEYNHNFYVSLPPLFIGIILSMVGLKII